MNKLCGVCGEDVISRVHEMARVHEISRMHKISRVHEISRMHKRAREISRMHKISRVHEMSRVHEISTVHKLSRLHKISRVYQISRVHKLSRVHKSTRDIKSSWYKAGFRFRIIISFPWTNYLNINTFMQTPCMLVYAMCPYNNRLLSTSCCSYINHGLFTWYSRTLTSINWHSMPDDFELIGPSEILIKL